LLDTISLSAPLESLRSLLYSPKREAKSNLSDLAIQIWKSKRTSRAAGVTFERDITVPQPKTSSVRATGAAKRGSKKELDSSRLTMKDLLGRLEKHEAECSLRYQRIEEKLAESREAMDAMDKKIDRFDGRLWAIILAVFLGPVITLFLTKLLGAL
jgi:hypothetical protein